LLYGELPQIIEFNENGLTFASDIKEGQKTGFFLDQKYLRKFFLDNPSLFAKKHVLNLFSYSGATGVYAVKSGAKSVHNVDLSERALDMCAVNAELNGISLKSFTTEKVDIFDWMEKSNDKFDVIILDPPALIKGNKYKERGEKAYHYLNKHALRLLDKDGILITSSCSHFLSDVEFANIIRQGATQLGIRIRVLAKIEQSNDHPYSVYFPEGKYLKSFVLQKY
jgi:23S rRNA (cytosine1962-C5)-methyltransferase